MVGRSLIWIGVVVGLGCGASNALAASSSASASVMIVIPERPDLATPTAAPSMAPIADTAPAVVFPSQQVLRLLVQQVDGTTVELYTLTEPF